MPKQQAAKLKKKIANLKKQEAAVAGLGLIRRKEEKDPRLVVDTNTKIDLRREEGIDGRELEVEVIPGRRRGAIEEYQVDIGLVRAPARQDQGDIIRNLANKQTGRVVALIRLERIGKRSEQGNGARRRAHLRVARRVDRTLQMMVNRKVRKSNKQSKNKKL